MDEGRDYDFRFRSNTTIHRRWLFLSEMELSRLPFPIFFSKQFPLFCLHVGLLAISRSFSGFDPLVGHRNMKSSTSKSSAQCFSSQQTVVRHWAPFVSNEQTYLHCRFFNIFVFRVNHINLTGINYWAHSSATRKSCLFATRPVALPIQSTVHHHGA